MKESLDMHSGFRYAEKPLGFEWDGKQWNVKRIIREQKTVSGYNFLIETDTSAIFELAYDEIDDYWQVNPFFR